MLNRAFLVCYFLLPLSSFGQVTIVVNQIPENTVTEKPIYISGDFEGWTGGQKQFKLERKNEGYYITLPKTLKDIQFKFTQGSWESVECDSNGNNINNRTYSFYKENDSITVNIINWSSPKEKVSTAAKNVSVLATNFEIPQLNRQRRIWIYLPSDYEKTKKSYPVLYMHDGQNIFNELTAYSDEWKVDETLNKINNETGFQCIVIGIDNGGDKRMNEYSPWENPKYGIAEGKLYVQFIVDTLKPYIDQNFRTKSNKENTAIMGSSMGGLISFYAGLEHPEVFGKIGVFSPSFWYSNRSFEFALHNSNLKATKMYFLVGDKEGGSMVPDMTKIIDIMISYGFSEPNISKNIIAEAQHIERFWSQEFERAILWLFTK